MSEPSTTRALARRLIPLLAISVACSGGGSGAPAGRARAPLPAPDLSRMEAPVRAQMEGARRELERLRRAEPGSRELARAYGRLGRLYHVYGLLPAARAAYENARRLDPDELRWSYYLGCVDRSTGDLSGASRELGRVVAARPGDAAALLRLAEVDLARGEPAAAEKAFRAARALPGAAAAAHRGLGLVAAADGRWAEAARHYEAALAEQPAASELHLHLAQAYRRLGQEGRAEREAAQQGEGRVRFPDPWLADLASLATGSAFHSRRGAVAAAEGRWADAAREYRRAAELDAGDADAREHLAEALERAGDREGALAAVADALALAPRRASLHLRRGRLLAAGGADAEAVAAYRAALALAPDDATARFNLGNALARLGRFGEAETAYDAVLAGDGDDGAAHLNRARVRARRGETPGALADYRAALASSRLPPGDAAWAHFELGELLAAQGRPADARSHYRAALALDPALSPARRALSELGESPAGSSEGRPHRPL